MLLAEEIVWCFYGSLFYFFSLKNKLTLFETSLFKADFVFFLVGIIYRFTIKLYWNVLCQFQLFREQFRLDSLHCRATDNLNCRTFLLFFRKRRALISVLFAIKSFIWGDFLLPPKISYFWQKKWIKTIRYKKSCFICTMTAR